MILIRSKRGWKMDRNFIYQFKKTNICIKTFPSNGHWLTFVIATASQPLSLHAFATLVCLLNLWHMFLDKVKSLWYSLFLSEVNEFATLPFFLMHSLFFLNFFFDQKCKLLIGEFPENLKNIKYWKNYYILILFFFITYYTTYNNTLQKVDSFLAPPEIWILFRQTEISGRKS